MTKRNVYLEDLPLAEALERLLGALAEAGALAPLEGEWVSLDEAAGRVTAEPVVARVSSPHYDAAAMDGYAVRAAETLGATETAPCRLAIGRAARLVDTGDPVPAELDAVIPIEDVQVLHAEDGGEAIEILAPVPPYAHVRAIGEDVVATELVLPPNRRLEAHDLGAIAASGHTRVLVRRRPRVAVQPTGTELVAPGGELRPGDIVEFNSLVLAAQARAWGAEATRLPPLPDDFERIRAAVEAALERHDVVVINAGASAGTEDHTARVIATLGRLLVHGVAIRPGHPVALGIARGKPILGLPGYPVSALLTSELFLQPLLARRLGVRPAARPTVRATLTRKLVSPAGLDERVRVSVGRVGDRVVATPLARGAGVITSMVRADGLLAVPRFSEGHHAGEEVTVELLRPPGDVDRTIVVIGSHDLTLDLLASRLARSPDAPRLSTTHVGSLGGLLALARGEAHLAGSHLLDEETGEYNVAYVRRHLAGVRVSILGFVGRVQGLIVAPGNPKGLTSIEDLARPDVRFVNRQRGAGTRVLLDYELKRRGLDPARIQGYGHQEFTHLAVATAVQGGRADCGLGILAAARALGLGFVPLLQERYDLVVPRVHLEGALLAPLLETLRRPEWRDEVEALGGYSTERMGEILAELG